ALAEDAADFLDGEAFGTESDAAAAVDLQVEEGGRDPAGGAVGRLRPRRTDGDDAVAAADHVDEVAGDVMTGTQTALNPMGHWDILPEPGAGSTEDAAIGQRLFQVGDARVRHPGF